MAITKRGRAAFMAILLAAASLAAPAEPASGSPFAPEPAFAAFAPSAEAQAGESLPLPRFIDAALLASGVSVDRLPAYRARLGSLLDSLASSEAIAAGADATAKGEALLGLLHERVFARYEVDATGLDQVLDSGRFNCVSSALLYAIAARRIGLDVVGVRTPDHAFCVLRAGPAGGRGIDVETTNRYGFDPGNKKEFKDSFGRVTGYAYAPPGAYSKREEVPDRVFVGLVLSNRAGILERSGRYSEALRLGADLAAFAPGPESRAFLLDRVNNVSAELSRRGDFAGARAFAEGARAALGDEPRLAELARGAAFNEAAAQAQAGRWDEALDGAAALAAGYPGLYAAGSGGQAGAAARRELGSLVEGCVNNLAVARLRAGDYAGARAVIEARRGLLEAQAGAERVRALELRVGEAELSAQLERLPFAEALARADAALAAGSVSRSRWEEAISFLFGNEANRLAREGDLLAAARAADEGAAKAPAAAQKLARFAAELRRAFAAKAHNEFAALYNAGKYDESLKVVEEALAKLPSDATLKADRATAAAAASR
jgi:tetratricopeptide (TPR) repeat protein